MSTQVYGSTTSGTGGVTSLATSSDWSAGYEWFVVDNSTNKGFDVQVQGQITVGTSPTSGTQIRIWACGSTDGTTWPTPMAGSAAARTWASAGVRDGVARVAATLNVDSTTSNRVYPYYFTLGELFGFVPYKTTIYVAHNTGVSLNATAANHTYQYIPITTA